MRYIGTRTASAVAATMVAAPPAPLRGSAIPTAAASVVVPRVLEAGAEVAVAPATVAAVATPIMPSRLCGGLGRRPAMHVHCLGRCYALSAAAPGDRSSSSSRTTSSRSQFATQRDLEASAAPSKGRSAVLVPIEEVAYTANIVESTRRGDERAALGWIKEMRSTPFRPNAYIYNSLISMFSKKGRWRSSVDWFRQMEAEGVKPTTVSYNAVIDCLGRAGRPEEAEIWFESLLKSCGVPDNRTYGAVLHSFAWSGRLHDTMRWLQRIYERGHVTDVEYSWAFRCLARQPLSPSHNKQAEDLLCHMRFSGVDPTENILRDVCRILGEDQCFELCRMLAVNAQKAKRLESLRTKMRSKWRSSDTTTGVGNGDND